MENLHISTCNFMRIAHYPCQITDWNVSRFSFWTIWNSISFRKSFRTIIFHSIEKKIKIHFSRWMQKISPECITKVKYKITISQKLNITQKKTHELKNMFQNIVHLFFFCHMDEKFWLLNDYIWKNTNCKNYFSFVSEHCKSYSTKKLVFLRRGRGLHLLN